MLKPGRPRLEDRPGFRERFATILPRLNAGEISQGRAARELGISVRSLKRYVKQAEGPVPPYQRHRLVQSISPEKEMPD
jgi:hypothetical protein